MSSKFSAIAGNTFLETIRQPIYGILMWTAAFWIAFFGPTLSTFTLEAGGDTKMLIDNCLATMLLYGLLASVFSATSVITREIDTYTVLTVISKPVSRPVFFLGKYGVLEKASDKYDQPVLILGTAAVAISLIAATFCNYMYGWHFSTTLTAWVVPLGTAAVLIILFFDKQWHAQSPLTNFGYKENITPSSIYFAIVLVFLALMILAAFAVTLSTRFSQVLTLILCTAIFFLGLLADYYLGSPTAQSTLLGKISYHLLPNFQFHWLGDAITQQLTVKAAHVARVAAYSILYTLGILSVGVALFQTREVG
jgi:hypothetical protein